MLKKNSGNKFIVLCGPSGVGKSSLIDRIIEGMGDHLMRTISYTTRKKRLDEKDGKDYFFISREEFLRKQENNEFIEFTHVYNDYYATSKEQVEFCWNKNKAVIKDLDLVGVKCIKKIYPQSLAIGVFVSDDQEIKRRIEKRNADFGQNLNVRLNAYRKEIKELKELCSVQILNDDFEKALFSLKKEIEKYLSSD